ncbi:MAG: protein translocase subunit SecD [Gammaproteobacteria bacterium]|nr:MAG: protein translocase subunit SecD [Gammaproteobacteria bacterium]
MINQYPLWKYILIALVIFFGAIYALPNLYEDDFAIQISSTSMSAKLEPGSVNKIKEAVNKLEKQPKAVEYKDKMVLLRYANSTEQLDAKALLSKSLAKEELSITLNIVSNTPAWLKSMHAMPMQLGLDLRGGIHFLMEVDTQAAITKRLETAYSESRRLLRSEGIRYRKVNLNKDNIEMIFKSEELRDKAESELRSEAEFADFRMSTSEDAQGRFVLTAGMDENSIKAITESALRKNITILRERVNKIGVAEPIVQRQGKNRIVVELPGIQDSAMARTFIGTTATLEFRLQDQENDAYVAKETGIIPSKSKLYFMKGNKRRPVLLQKEIMLTGEYIQSASSAIDPQTGLPIVNIRLNQTGGSKFYEATRDNVGRPMGTVFSEDIFVGKEVVDGETKWITKKKEEVINVATIRDALSTRFQISGIDSMEEATNLAKLLEAGSLAAPIYFVEERTVGPSMGEKNIEQGQMAVTIGFLLVVVFMAIYYKTFGIVADVALFANLALMVALLSLFRATLTMPGIAGIVLTVGMAVDANVLIFERIREELRNGLSPQAAIDSGYDKAFWTIFDANLTTFIAAILLFSFGTGPIKGFAVTLSIGIATSMFTATMGTRAIVNLVFGGRKIKWLSI